MKGIRDFDVATAYEGMRKNHLPGGLMGHGHYEHHTALQGGVEDYIRYGYVPADGRPKGWIAEPNSATLEYAYDDWCLAQMAKALAKEDDCRMFLTPGRELPQLVRPAKRLHACRGSATARWVAPFDPSSELYWCETYAWQGTWFVPHDVEGLIRLMGGRETFNRRLNDTFQRAAASNFVGDLGYVNYGNQPSMEMAHLFNYSGAPGLPRSGSARSRSGRSAAPRRTRATTVTKTKGRPAAWAS